MSIRQFAMFFVMSLNGFDLYKLCPKHLYLNMLLY